MFCVKEKQTRGTTMNRLIVVAIDADLSDATQLALHAASSLLARSLPPTGAVLLHVIPVPDMPQSRFGTSRFTPTAEQRELAEHALHRARLNLLKQGIVPEQIELRLRSGAQTHSMHGSSERKRVMSSNSRVLPMASIGMMPLCTPLALGLRVMASRRDMSTGSNF
jgi:hypothetical protein